MINFNNSLAFIISAIFLTTYLNRKNEIIKLIKNPKAKTSKASKVCLALVGGGSFAKGMHLENLKFLQNISH